MERWADLNVDVPALARLFFDSVRSGPSPYTDAQRAAWMPKVPPADRFADRLHSQFVAVAEHERAPYGFMSMDQAGYIDLAYILPTHRGTGTFRRLYLMLEERGTEQGLRRFWTHASLTAQPAFRSVGFSIIQHENVERAGQNLQRAEMEKLINDA